MRKLMAVIALSGLIALLGVVPASAVPPKKVHGSFGATLAPFPNLSSATGTARPGCAGGQEGVNWVAQEFKAPGAGKLRVYMEGFTGDHDLYVLVGDIVYARSEAQQISTDDPSAGAPAEEEIIMPLKKGQTVTLVACNWFGQPDVQAHYAGTFR